MPAARYWRVVGIAPYTAGGDLELGELQLYGSGARLDTPGMLSCSHAPVSGTLAALSDGSAATACRFAAAHVKSGGFFIRWDLGSAQSADALRLAGGSAQALYADTLTLQYSADAVSWTTAAELGRCAWPGAAQFGGLVSYDFWFDQTQLVLHYDGSFTNASPAKRGFTNSGVTLDAASKFGSGAARFNGSASLYTSAFTTTSDFLFETWLWLDALPADVGTVYSNFAAGGGAGSHLLYVNPNGSLHWYFDGNNNIQTAAGAVQASRWNHVRLTKKAGSPATFTIYVDGTQAAQTTFTQATLGTASANFYLGHAGWTTTRMFKGMLDETAVAFALRDTGAFVPPTVPYARVYGADPRPVSIQAIAGAQRVAAGTMQAFSIKRISRPQVACDVEFGGLGRIWGVNEIEIAPNTRVPTGGRVVLLRQRDKLLARQTWADPVTGAWEFTGLDVRQDFIALAEDLAGNYRPVAANRLTPEAS